MVSSRGQAGYLGVFLLMLGENLFPPIPLEVVMPLAGFLAAQGTLSLPGAIIAGTAGALLGTLFWYWVGWRFGAPRLCRLAEGHGRWLTVSPRDIDDATAWFARRDGRVVFLGRMVPALRTLILIPAGIARMPVGPFLLLTALGSALWTGVLAVAGFLLEGQYDRVEAWVNPASTLVVALLLLWYLARLVRLRRA